MPKTPKRFFIAQEINQKTSEVRLDQAESHYLRNVLRLRERDVCIVLDTAGFAWSGQVSSVQKGSPVRVQVTKKLAEPVLRSTTLTIAQAIPQRGKLDTLIEKGVELGLHTLIPIITDRTIVRMSSEAKKRVHQRWCRIEQGARKQSQSRFPSKIELPTSFADAVNQLLTADVRYYCHPMGGKTLSDALYETRVLQKEGHSLQIAILIGPEGGFSEKEVDLAEKNKFQKIDLGENILKTDTAFMAVASWFCLGLSR